jgi:uncharacterized protein
LTETEAIQLLKKVGISDNIISHSLAVCRKALQLADYLRKKGCPVNLYVVRLGALLHDIGRSKTHGIDHGIVGSKILASMGVDNAIARIAKTHVLGGFSPREAKELGLGNHECRPITIEEKIVCFADKITCGSRYITIKQRFIKWRKKYGHTKILSIAESRIQQIERELKLNNQNFSKNFKSFNCKKFP